MQLSDRCFLITGGGSGLGAACARRFARAGACVVVSDIEQDAALHVAQECGNRVFACTADVTSAESIQKAIDLAIDRHGALHGVLNCAGILGASRLLSRSGPHDLELFRRVIDVNLTGTFNVIRLAASRMAEHPPQEDQERGVIINTSSVAALEGQIGQAAYAASKGGVAALTLPLARELAKYGIRVVAIAPGIFATPMLDALPDAVRGSLSKQTVFPARFGQADEFAALAQQVVENPMINGALLRLDGAVRLNAT